eukprot:1181369-Prorocentrum_minimum.AAC.6
MAGIDVGLLGKDGRKAVGRVCARILRSWVGTARLATTARTTSSFHTPEKGRQDKHHVVGGGLPGVGMVVRTSTTGTLEGPEGPEDFPFLDDARPRQAIGRAERRE